MDVEDWYIEAKAHAQNSGDVYLVWLALHADELRRANRRLQRRLDCKHEKARQRTREENVPFSCDECGFGE